MVMGENNVALPNSQPISHLVTYNFRVLVWKDASSRGRGHIRFLMFRDWFRSLKRLCGVTFNFLYLIQRAGLVDRGGKSERAKLMLKLNGFSLHTPHFTILITFTLFVIVSKEIRKKKSNIWLFLFQTKMTLFTGMWLLRWSLSWFTRSEILRHIVFARDL